jgi:LytS/YehU family sensor histidine kinase
MIVTKSTRKKNWLSQDELQTLEERVEKHQDGNAAYRIASYYQSNPDETAKMLFWVKKSAELGNEDGKKMWEQLQNLKAER